MNQTHTYVVPKLLLGVVVTALFATAFASDAAAQTCRNRGALDTLYCDENNDLVADPVPGGGAAPNRLVIGFGAVEDPDVYERTYRPFVDYLSTCTKTPTTLFPSTSEPRVIQAMREGRIQVAQFATGAVMFAVNQAGAVPFAAKGRSATGKFDAYHLMLIVAAQSDITRMAQLRGKTVAHTTATSNSGNLAPRALFPALGLRPEIDYKVEFSGKHDKSIVGVKNGFYAGAAVASDVFNRMVDRGEVRSEDFRVLWRSENFPADAFVHHHSLPKTFADRLKKCFFDYEYNDAMKKQLEGNDRFFAVDYKRDWAVVRQVATTAGQKFDRASYEALLKNAKAK